ncbi:MAG TPA: SPW repeat protein [Burkholderiales bacterium]|nr:SPW repeat protein [Burkholderiales bacterium]
MQERRWQDWVMLIFGIWLFLSPFWMPAYASTSSTAAWNSYVLGVLVVIFAWAALAKPEKWEEWVNLVLGIWLIIAPFVLRFYHAETGAAWNQIILGILIAADALWVLAQYGSPQVRT